jgi:hypothetical protein
VNGGKQSLSAVMNLIVYKILKKEIDRCLPIDQSLVIAPGNVLSLVVASNGLFRWWPHPNAAIALLL